METDNRQAGETAQDHRTWTSAGVVRVCGRVVWQGWAGLLRLPAYSGFTATSLSLESRQSDP